MLAEYAEIEENIRGLFCELFEEQGRFLVCMISNSPSLLSLPNCERHYSLGIMRFQESRILCIARRKRRTSRHCLSFNEISVPWHVLCVYSLIPLLIFGILSIN